MKSSLSMQKKFIFAVVLVSSLFISGCGVGKEILIQSIKSDTPKPTPIISPDSFAPVDLENIEPYGNILTTQDGRTLYTYAKDSDFKSKCYDDCAVARPPFIVNLTNDVGGSYGVTERKDGRLQVTINGKPLYTYAPDSTGVVTGDEPDGEWNVVILSNDKP